LVLIGRQLRADRLAHALQAAGMPCQPL
jgi:hypothetical protein